MQTPALENGDPAVGPNAAPSWLFDPNASPELLIKELEWLKDNAKNHADLTAVDSLLKYSLERSYEIK